MNLAEAATRRANNFDALRLVAAFLVLVSHSFPIAGDAEPVSSGGLTIGAFGVCIFFAISGFLVTQSWIRQPRVGRFVIKRCLRIFPALAGVLVVTTYVLGPVVTSLSLSEYLSNPATHAYAVHNLSLRTDYLLPGVFETVPYPNAVNGSLWTLPIEMRAYVAIAIIGLAVRLWPKVTSRSAAGLARPTSAATATAALVCALILIGTLSVAGTAAYGFDVPNRAQVAGGFAQTPFFMIFGAAALLLMGSRRIALRWDLAAVALVLGYLAWRWAILARPIGVVVLALVVPYVVLVVAYRAPPFLRSVTTRGDYSYGILSLGVPSAADVHVSLGRRGNAVDARPRGRTADRALGRGVLARDRAACHASEALQQRALHPRRRAMTPAHRMHRLGEEFS